MKKLFTFLILAALSHAVIAQSITLQQADTLYCSGSAAYTLSAENTVVNNTSGNVNIKWTRYELSIPAGWTTSVCDKNNCYAIGTNSMTFYLTPTGQSGYTGLLKGNFNPNNVPGTGVMKVSLSSPDGMTSYGDAYFIATTYADGVTTKVETVKDIFIYPTPVKENMNVVFNQSLNPSRIDIFNVLGQKVRTFPLQLDRSNFRTELSLTDLDKGLYFLRVYQAGSSEVITKQFTKE